MTNTGRTFLLKLRSLRPDEETTRNLRLILKKLLRQWGVPLCQYNRRATG